MFLKVSVPKLNRDMSIQMEIPERTNDDMSFFYRIRNCIVNILKKYEGSLPDLSEFEGFHTDLKIGVNSGMTYSIGEDYQECNFHPGSPPLILYIDLFYSEWDLADSHVFRFYPCTVAIWKTGEPGYQDTNDEPCLIHEYHVIDKHLCEFKGVKYEPVSLEDLEVIVSNI